MESKVLCLHIKVIVLYTNSEELPCGEYTCGAYTYFSL